MTTKAATFADAGASPGCRAARLPLFAGLVPVTLVVPAITPFRFRAVGFALLGAAVEGVLGPLAGVAGAPAAR